MIRQRIGQMVAWLGLIWVAVVFYAFLFGDGGESTRIVTALLQWAGLR